MECTSHPSNPILTLKNDLFCNYDPIVSAPSQHSNTTAVSIRLVLQLFQFWPESDLLRLHVWMDLDWTDVRLTWDPASYSSFGQITIDRHVLWFPDLVLHSAWKTEDMMPIPQNVTCNIQHTGNVSCRAPVVLSSRCSVDARKWPYDQHNCSLYLVSDMEWVNGVDLQLHTPPVLLYRLRQNQDWRLVELAANRYVQHFRGSLYPWLQYDVIMQRHSEGNLAVVIVPAIVLAVLTLTTFWVEPECTERIFMCCLNVASHALFLLYMIYMVPTNADNLPLVLRFFVDSFVLASLLTVTSVVTYALSRRQRVPPAYVSQYVKSVSSGLVGTYLIPEELKTKGNDCEDNEQEINEAPGCKKKIPLEWLVIANLVDRAVFILYALVIVILMYRLVV